MRVRALPVACLLASLTLPAAAQDIAQLEAALDAVRSSNRVLLSGSLPLDANQAKGFWPEYDRYERELKPIDLRSARLIAEIVASGGAPAAGRVEALVAEHIQLQQDRLKLLSEHVRRVGKLLPAARLARYVQLDNRLDLQLRYELAQRIPLVN